MYIIDTTCFNECFSFHVITERHYFYMQIYRYPDACCYVFFNKCFERSPHFLSIISTITLQCCYTKGPQQSLHFLNLLIAFCCPFSLWMFHIFLKSSLETCFLLRAILKFLTKIQSIRHLLLCKQWLCNVKKFINITSIRNRAGRKHKKLRKTKKLVFQIKW